MTGFFATLRMRTSCWWTFRRLQRYLDADPSAPLAPEEYERLQAHLKMCQRCETVADEYRELSRALSDFSRRNRAEDPDSLVRLQELSARLSDGEHR